MKQYSLRVRNYLLDFQDRVCAALTVADGSGSFREERWSRPEGGGGISRLLSGGKLFEKAGVNFSHVHGQTLPPSASVRHPELAGEPFQAMGVSLVLHPLNPYVPTSHANFRFFRADAGAEVCPSWWFGGGYDLTPYYGFEEDCRHWHSTAQKACAPFGPDVYARFKKWCDSYFFIKHRNEPRGIGGIFFEDLNEWDFNKTFEFVRSVADGFLPAYLPIVSRRQNHPFSEREREFQLYRRGRYVEFNLLYDRGTLFGIQSNGRVESILMSLPPLAAWPGDWLSHVESDDAKRLQKLLAPRDWVS